MSAQIERVEGGITVEDFLEREAGGVHHVAVILVDLGSSVEHARSEWEYDESDEGKELHRLVAQLDDFLKDLSILPDGTLTRNRKCWDCGGRGTLSDESRCAACGGRGSINAEEADG